MVLDEHTGWDSLDEFCGFFEIEIHVQYSVAVSCVRPEVRTAELATNLDCAGLALLDTK